LATNLSQNPCGLQTTELVFTCSAAPRKPESFLSSKIDCASTFFYRDTPSKRSRSKLEE